MSPTPFDGILKYSALQGGASPMDVHDGSALDTTIGKYGKIFTFFICPSYPGKFEDL
jgi:hypothetical protein